MNELPVLLPLDPRTHAAAERAGLDLAGSPIRFLEPTRHADFLTLARHAALLVTDSGKVVEEAAVLGRPVVVVNRSTEQLEKLANRALLACTPPELLAAAVGVLRRREESDRRLTHPSSPLGGIDTF